MTINPVALTVIVTSTSKSYGAALPTLTAGSVTGLVNGDTVGTTIAVSLTTTATAASAVGVYPISVTVGGTASGNYTLTNTPGLLTINQVALTVTVTSASKNYGAALPTLTTSSVTGLVNGDTVGTTITVSLSTTATAASSIWVAYPITAATVGGTAKGNYTLTNTPGLLTISPGGTNGHGNQRQQELRRGTADTCREQRERPGKRRYRRNHNRGQSKYHGDSSVIGGWLSHHRDSRRLGQRELHADQYSWTADY